MSRLLEKKTLKKFYKNQLFSSQYLKTIDQIRVPRESDDNSALYLKEFFTDLYFQEHGAPEGFSEINKRVL